ncbi:MAG TPA: VCBS repeat-containing protein [Kofleriaceae bacterium]|jgi:hypothetical protein
MRWFVLLLAIGCQRGASKPADPVAPQRRDVTALVGKAARAAIGDVGGHPALVLVDADAMRVIDRSGKEVAREPVPAGIEQLSIAGGAILAGWGESREHRGVQPSVTRTRLDKGQLLDEIVVAPTSARADVVGVIPEGADLIVAYFDSKYGVTEATASRTGDAWTTSAPISIRMATSWARGDLDGSGTRATVVGRLYGDDKGVDGDAFILGADGTRTVLPTTRGVQSLALADTDGDGRAEIFVGDGWHQSYLQHAQGLLTWIRKVDGAWHAELIENTPGQYAILQIVAADLDGDGKPELVTRGNKYVRAYKRSGDTWKGLTIGGEARDIAVGDIDGKGVAVLIVGDKSELVDLHGSWR